MRSVECEPRESSRGEHKVLRSVSTLVSISGGPACAPRRGRCGHLHPGTFALAYPENGGGGWQGCVRRKTHGQRAGRDQGRARCCPEEQSNRSSRHTTSQRASSSTRT